MAKGVYIGTNKANNNLIDNGIFLNTSGWNTNNVIASIDNGSLKLEAPSTSATYKWAYTTNTIPLIKDHKYYISVKLKKTGGGATRWGMYRVSDTTQFWFDSITSDYSSFTRLSRLYTATATGDTNFLLYSVGATWASGMICWWDDLFVIDLTDLYGAGNEPNLVESDEDFSINSSTGVVSCIDSRTGIPIFDDVARKVKKIYIGVDNVARKVKKAYIGVGGVARPFFSSGGIEYYGAITPLSVARSNLSATTVGNYALFGGGSGASNVVDAYDTILTRTTPTELITVRYDLSATTVGNYALFGGGRRTSTGVLGAVDAYDTSLTKTIPNTLTSRYSLSATTVGNYAVFGGGYYRAPVDAVDAYNTSLTRSMPSRLDTTRSELSATTVGNYALFGGGLNKFESSDVVDAYDTSLTKTMPTALSVGRYWLSATTVGNYALFGGGNSSSKVVDAYNTSLTRTTPTTLSVGRSNLSATTVGNYALFGGGSGASNVVDAYDTSLTRTIPTTLSVARSYLSATTVGNYALFGGGKADNGAINTVDAYVINS